MSVVLSGVIAIVLMYFHRHFTTVKGSGDVLSGMASAVFWLLFTGAAWTYSLGDLTNIYTYFVLVGIVMVVVMMISSLAWKPTQESRQELAQDNSGTYLERLRKRLGHRPLK